MGKQQTMNFHGTNDADNLVVSNAPKKYIKLRDHCYKIVMNFEATTQIMRLKDLLSAYYE
jgi:hypothetical protein